MRTHAVLACIVLTMLCVPAAAAEPAAPVTAPGWVKDIAPGTWAAVSKNTPADVDPAKDPKVNPNHPKAPPWKGNLGQMHVTGGWNGGALATRYGAKGSLILFGGGHAGYYGNEVYAFDLEKCLWSRVTDPYAGPLKYAEGKDAYPEGRHPDGSPTVPHTYEQVDYHPGSNSFITFKSTRNNSGGYIVHTAFLLSFDTRKWQHSPMNDKSHGNSGGFSAYDTLRDVFWVQGGAGTNTFAKFDPKVKNPDGTVGQWTNYEKKMGGGMDLTAAYDPLHDLIVVANFRSPDSCVEALRGVCVIDPKNPDKPVVRVTDEGARPPSGGKEGAAGWEWSALRQSFLHWRRGAELRELRPPAGDWKTGKWTWSTITDAAANKAEPEAMKVDNGVYSRFQIAHYADAEVVVVINNVKGPVWAFRVPEPAKGR